MKLRKLSVLMLMLILIFTFSGGYATAQDGVVELTETITGTVEDVGEISVSYPSGWFTEGDIASSLFLGNIEDMRNARSIESGQVAVIVSVFPDATMAVLNGEDTSLTDMLGLISEQLTSDATEPLSEVEEFELNGMAAASVSGQVPFTGNVLAEGTIILLEIDSGYALVIAITPDNELADNLDAIHAIVGSIRVENNESGDTSDAAGDDTVTDIELSETYTEFIDDVGQISINYPSGWFIEGDLISSLYITHLQTGPAFVSISILSNEDIVDFTGGEEMELADILVNISEWFATENSAPFSEVEEFELNGMAAASVFGEEILSDGQVSEDVIILLEIDGGYAIAFGMALDYQLADNLADFHAILGSIHVENSEDASIDTELSETYTEFLSNFGTVSFQYSSDWSIERDFTSSVFLSNLKSGPAYLQISITPDGGSSYIFRNSKSPLVDMARVLTENRESDTLTFGGIEEFELNGNPAVRAFGQEILEDGRIAEIVFIMIDIDGDYVSATGMTFKDELADNLDEFYAILGSISVRKGRDTSNTNDAPRGIELAQTYSETAEGVGEISFKYPSGWSVEGSLALGTVIVTNIEDVTAAESFEAGQAAVVVTVLPGEQVAALTAANGDMTLADILGLMSETMASEGAEPFGAAEEFEINGLSAASVSGKQPFVGEELAEVTVILVNIGDGYAMVIGMAPDGELADNVDTFRAIAGSVSIEAAAAD